MASVSKDTLLNAPFSDYEVKENTCRCYHLSLGINFHLLQIIYRESEHQINTESYHFNAAL